MEQHTIDTGDATPITQRTYRTTPENNQEIDRQVMTCFTEKPSGNVRVSPGPFPLRCTSKEQKRRKEVLYLCEMYRDRDAIPGPSISLVKILLS